MSDVLTAPAAPQTQTQTQTPTAAAATLERVAGEAFHKYPGSCSHAVWYVIKQYVPDQPYLVANALLTFLAQDKRWKETPVGEAAARASRGELVVGGAAESPNGHVVVVYPGPEKFNGGFKIAWEGKQITVRSTGLYPRALSTSLGNWPGAKSNGDKTVWDAWGKDAKFAKVKFWRYDPSGE